MITQRNAVKKAVERQKRVQDAIKKEAEKLRKEKEGKEKKG